MVAAIAVSVKNAKRTGGVASLANRYNPRMLSLGLVGERGAETTMATAEDSQIEITFSSQALDLLDCFSCGFDDFLSRIAEHIAFQRGEQGKTVEITEEDIVKAANIFAEKIKASDLEADVKHEVDSMLECLSRKRRHGR